MSTTIDDPDVTLFDGSDWRTFHDAPGGWHGGTYHETCDDRDDLNIAFKGTGIQIFGAKRPTYGYYYAELDGENRRFFNAHSTTDEIPALLFEAKDLPDADHSVWFMNQQNYGTQRSRSCIGIDYIVIQQSGTSEPGAPISASDSASGVSDPASASTSPNGSPTPESATQTSSGPVGPGTPMSSASSSGGGGLTVPNLANFTMAPSANEVNSPNATWTGESMTAVTGMPGVYSGQPMPVYTGQAMMSIGSPPHLQQEVFASAVIAGAPNAGIANVNHPGAGVLMACVSIWIVRKFWVL